MGNTISQQERSPTSLMHCFDKDGKLDNDLVLLYRHHRLRQSTLCDNVAMSLVNAAIVAAEEEESDEKQIKSRRYRSCFRKQINLQRLDDGMIVPVEPVGSTWYITYVHSPDLADPKFILRFQR
jgi:hypothetical protein